MDFIVIQGGKRLEGTIPISGAKNSALTLLPCAILTDEKLTLSNLPRLADVDSFGHLLNELGVSTKIEGLKKGEIGRRMTLQAENLISTVAPYDMVRRMRASILVLGPLLARAGDATVSLPGGCAIGDRPIDLHLQALEAIGAEIEIAAGFVRATAPGGKRLRAATSPSRWCRSARPRMRSWRRSSRPAGPTSTMPRASPRSSTFAACSRRWAPTSRAKAARTSRSRASRS